MRQPSYGGGGMFGGFGGMQGGFGGMQGGFGGGGFARGMGGMGGMGNPFGQMMGQQGPQMGQFGGQPREFMPQAGGQQDLRAMQQAGAGGRGNQGQDMKIDIDQFQAKPPPPRQMTPAGMGRLLGGRFGGGFQSQGPQNLRMQQMQAAQRGGGMGMRRPTQMGIGSMRPPLMAFGQGGFNPQSLTRASAQILGGRGGFFR
jgi:hypothetical protein